MTQHTASPTAPAKLAHPTVSLTASPTATAHPTANPAATPTARPTACHQTLTPNPPLLPTPRCCQPPLLRGPRCVLLAVHSLASEPPGRGDGIVAAGAAVSVGVGGWLSR